MMGTSADRIELAPFCGPTSFPMPLPPTFARPKPRKVRTMTLDPKAVELSAADEAQMARCQLAWIEEGKNEPPHRIAVIRKALERLSALSTAPSGQAPLERVKALEWVKVATGEYYQA